MSNVIIPEGYEPILGLKETQRAIKKIKDYFQQELAYGLQLRRVSAPLFVFPETGLPGLEGVSSGTFPRKRARICSSAILRVSGSSTSSSE